MADKFVREFFASRQNAADIRNFIERFVETSVHKRSGAVAMRTERYFAVRAGQNGLLDVARKTYTEVLDDVQTLKDHYAEQYLMESLKLKNNAKRGYFLCGEIP